MIDCLLSLCLVTGFYIDASIGYQPSQMPPFTNEEFSNSYGANVGEAKAVLELKKGFYIEARHLSGLNTFESDGGLNTISVGAKIYLWESK